MGRLCHDCGERVADDRTRCDTCGRPVHRDCADYHDAFDPRCGEEPWIGTVEY